MKWLIWSPGYGKSAGVRVLHRLTHLLNLAGEESYIGANQLNPEWKTPEGSDINGSIVIYPEIASTNPWNSHNYCIYGLNAPGAIGGEKIYRPGTTLIGYHDRWIGNYGEAIDKSFNIANIVTLGLIDPKLFRSDGTEKRSQDLCWVYKGANLRNSFKFENESMMRMISFEWPASRQDLANELRVCKNFYSYDRDTALLYEAYLCGCIVWCMGDNGVPYKWEPDYFELRSMIAVDELDIDKAIRFKNIVLEEKGMKKKGSEFFIAIYTNECKRYCDEPFFKRLKEITTGQACIIRIVDNSVNEAYFSRLCKMIDDLQFTCEVYIDHIEVDRADKKTLFQRNVTDSLALLQTEFLKSNKQYFVTLESDVLPNDTNLFQYFLEVVNKADIIGGIYYYGFHTPQDFDPLSQDLVNVPHVLSGVTLYKRAILERFKFRFDPENLVPFPDAWMSIDAGQDFVLANYQKIKCDHMNDSVGLRGHERLV